MRVILVGSREERARMRASLNGSIRIVGEFPSLTDAEAAGLEVDGILVSPRVRLPPSRAKRASASLAEAFGGGGPDTAYAYDSRVVRDLPGRTPNVPTTGFTISAKSL
jgi:hypothetical protein